MSTQLEPVKHACEERVQARKAADRQARSRILQPRTVPTSYASVEAPAHVRAQDQNKSRTSPHEVHSVNHSAVHDHLRPRLVPRRRVAPGDHQIRDFPPMIGGHEEHFPGGRVVEDVSSNRAVVGERPGTRIGRKAPPSPRFRHRGSALRARCGFLRLAGLRLRGRHGISARMVTLRARGRQARAGARADDVLPMKSTSIRMKPRAFLPQP